VERVVDEARTAEIARMLGGVPSGASLLHARELLA
jgi:DNA repair ATPase RecN